MKPQQSPNDVLRVLECVARYKATHDGNSPSLREVRNELNLTSTGRVVRALGVLQHMGLIAVPEGTSRGIQFTGNNWSLPYWYAGIKEQPARFLRDVDESIAAMRDDELPFDDDGSYDEDE